MSEEGEIGLKEKILAIGAHPDDCEYGCFGTLAKLICKGWEVYLLYMVYGELEKGGRIISPVTRIKEAQKSAEILGAKSVEQCDFTVSIFSEVKPNFVDAIMDKIEQVNPKRVYVNSPYDTHQNHRIAYECTRIASRKVNSLLLYETPSTTGRFNPNLYVDISKTINTKLDALNAYVRQAKKPYFREENIRTLAKYRYFQSQRRWHSDGYAEAFTIERMFNDETP